VEGKGAGLRSQEVPGSPLGKKSKWIVQREEQKAIRNIVGGGSTERWEEKGALLKKKKTAHPCRAGKDERPDSIKPDSSPKKRREYSKQYRFW